MRKAKSTKMFKLFTYRTTGRPISGCTYVMMTASAAAYRATCDRTIQTRQKPPKKDTHTYTQT